MIDGIIRILANEINPCVRVCAIDSTALRSSRNDREAKVGMSVVLGKYKGYKLHMIASVTDKIIVPIAYEVTSANEHDSKVLELLYEAKIFEPTYIVADAAYDTKEWFLKARELGMKLVAGVNMRRSKRVEDFRDNERYENAVFLSSPIGKSIYKKRVRIEQLFSRLKGMYHLENSRLYGYKRYAHHVRWVILSYLIDVCLEKDDPTYSFRYPWNK